MTNTEIEDLRYRLFVLPRQEEGKQVQMTKEWQDIFLHQFVIDQMEEANKSCF